VSVVVTPLPEPFVSRMKNILHDEIDEFLRAMDDPPLKALRMNPFKGAEPPLHQSTEKVPWCLTAFFLNEKIDFDGDPLWHAGAYYVQEPSTLFLDYILRIIKEKIDVSTILDISASPGGKTTICSSIFPDALIVANEVNKKRIGALVQNIRRWGLPNTIVIQNHPDTIGSVGELFDIVIADVPCSGEGLFRKEPQWRKMWHPNLIPHFASIQKNILENAVNALKAGGFLIYSTCTFSKEENEEQIEYLMEGGYCEPFPIYVPTEWGITSLYGGSAFRFYPHKTKGEGFFVAILRKQNIPSIKKPYFEKPHEIVMKKVSPSHLHLLHHYFASVPHQWFYNKKNKDNSIVMLNNTRHMEIIIKNFRVVYVGFPIGEVRGNDIYLFSDMCLSIHFNSPSMRAIEIPRERALSSLTRTLKKKSYNQVLTYRGIPISCI